VSKKGFVAALLVAAVAVAGLGAWLVRDGATAPAGSAAPARSAAGKPGPDDGFRDLPASDGDGALTAEQQAKLRAALEKLAAEGNRRALLAGGVDSPWPEAVAQKEYDACVARVKGTLGGSPGTTDEQICSCATRVMQQVFPKERP
jgi:hypothetical protein